MMNPRTCFAMEAAVVAAVFCVFLAGVPRAGAELIVYEGFDYEDGNLRGHNGGQGDWTSAWFRGSGFGSGSSWQVSGPSLSYTDSGGRSLVTSGKAVRADAGTANQEHRDARNWDTTGHTDDGSVTWFSFLFNRGSNTESGNLFYIVGDAGLFNGLGVWLNPNNVAARINQQTAGYTGFSQDEDHFVVGRITFSDDEDEVRIWLDPELDEQPLDSALNSGVLTHAANQGNWRSLYMRHSHNPGLDMIDEIRIGTDFFSVAPYIPEPGSLVLLALGAGVLWRRR